MTNYLSIPLLVIMLTAYLVSLVLVRMGKISLVKQRRFWNIILLISFLFSASLGLLMAISFDLKIPILVYRNILSLHVKAGVVMAVVGLFHGLWHVSYFKAMIPQKKK